jgi:predicted amidohydrolase YtcJ
MTAESARWAIHAASSVTARARDAFPLLIRNADLNGCRVDLRIRHGVICAINPVLQLLPDEEMMDADGGAILPGLHDHHIHLNASAAMRESVRCGPPLIGTAVQLAAALNAVPGSGWIRGIGYHDSVAGEIDRDWLDRFGPERPIRIQHRSGRMWILNSRALVALSLDFRHGGRLIDVDALLRSRLPDRAPDLMPIGVHLASLGVTGLTEVTPRNGPEDYRRLAEAGLPQRLVVMGKADLADMAPCGQAQVGAVKLHYHDHDLPPLDTLVSEIGRAHGTGRAVASHCTTTVELMLTLAAIEEAGPMPGDRIEHASVVTPANAEWIARLGLTIVTQPHFLAERGAAYRVEVEPGDRPWLYRLAGLKRAGIGLAAGSDAPFGTLDPWAAMAAAVDRPEGFGNYEALTPEEALALYTGTAIAPATQNRKVVEGSVADLCVLDRPWSAARCDLAAVRVRATLVGGAVAYSSVR